MLLYCVIVVVLISSLVSDATASTCSVSSSQKKDCGYIGVTEDDCVKKNCCWQSVANSTDGDIPWCYYPSEAVKGSYKLTDMKLTDDGYSGTLQMSSTDDTDSISTLALTVLFENEDIAHVKITDANSKRWEVPTSIIPRDSLDSRESETNNYKFTYSEDPFSFEIVRVADGRSIFKLDSNSFIFKDQYISFTTEISSTAKTFGIGESTRLTHALTAGSTYTLWAADIPALAKDSNLYGSYPYYLQMVDGAAHGVMLMNSNGMDVIINDDSTAITFNVIGGIIDLYFFTGSSPTDVVSQYTQVVGKPMMMPYWSLGFHNCKYGYTSVYQVEEVVANYSAAGIPLDTQWMDIDYMQEYRDFTWDSKNFPESTVSDFVDKLHQNGQHFVPIIDPGIMVYNNYDAYDEGMKKDLFVKDINGDNYLGQVWPGPVYFPDFLHPDTNDYWADQIEQVYKGVKIDGLWIDMNEVSNFCNEDGMGQACANTQPGGCPSPGASQTDCCLVCTTLDSTNKYDFPQQYAIHNKQSQGLLSSKTMAMSAKHYGDVQEYDAHNLYGLTEQIATNYALTKSRGKRPFLLSRSSFLSTGAHSAKWTGDNGATWDDLKSSIISIMDFNIFGVPMIGADICGFIYTTTEELCARWIEVGAFYPFSRDHNAIGEEPQELYLWDSVAQASKNALGMRYQLLPYMYTLFYKANTLGSTVINPLWMTFPSDPNSLNIYEQFMIGESIMISPVLYEGVTSVNAYFPPALWYSYSLELMQKDAVPITLIDTSSSTDGGYKTLVTPLTSVNVHVKGGSILPLQKAAMTTTESRKTPFTLLAALCSKDMAKGSLFWDDGEQIKLDKYLSISYMTQIADGKGTFTSTVDTNTFGDSADDLSVQTIKVMGRAATLSSKPTKATLNGKDLSLSQIALNVYEDVSVLSFKNLELGLGDAIDLAWN